VRLPPPDTTHAAEKHSEVIGWPEGKTPIAPAGFTVTAFAEGLDHPRWIYVAPNNDIVANTDGLLRYPYKEGQNSMTAKGEKILDLPAGGYNHHWTRNIIPNADGSKIYVSVGSASNVGEYGMEEEVRRTNVLEINPDGTSERIYASGPRNPVGMDLAPGTNTLWTGVNERDKIGNNLVPDYQTSVRPGAFYTSALR
jgi:glucose/arabinose dehydrogenase